MLWFLFKISLLLFSFQVSAKEFAGDECLKSDYTTIISHQGEFFGLLKTSLYLEKRGCLLKVKYKKLIETAWDIDFCREPIHVKVKDKGSLYVHKRAKKCKSGDPSEYCESIKELHDIIQDFGLIFAQGERESLSTDHGKAYCSHLLLKAYLYDGRVFSKYDEQVSLKKGTSKEHCEIPKKETSEPVTPPATSEEVISDEPSF